MEIIIVLLVMIAVLVVPVMVAAKLLKARNHGFWSALIAVIAVIAVDAITDGLIAQPLIAALVSIALTALCFSFILGARFLQSVVIAVVAFGIQLGIIVILGALGFASSGMQFNF
ncbi:MAG: hypothetical protein HWE13_14735 [Gammaproteobacteria bacterium]|nr:hypothetical protein [Gammaproteobacteria bacterium]